MGLDIEQHLPEIRFIGQTLTVRVNRDIALIGEVGAAVVGRVMNGKNIIRLNAEFTGQTVERIEADSDRDRWFTAQEALEYGFVDHVVARAQQAGGTGN